MTYAAAGGNFGYIHDFNGGWKKEITGIAFLGLLRNREWGGGKDILPLQLGGGKGQKTRGLMECIEVGLGGDQ